MLRDLMAIEIVPVPAGNKAAVDLTTGMGVVIDVATGTAKLPTAETAADIYLVHKEHIPNDLEATLGYFSDYDKKFNSVAAGDYVVLYPYHFGTEFGTSEYVDTLTDADAGKRVAVGTDGKWKLATVASKYIFNGLLNDAGHILADISVSDTAVANS